MRRDFHRRAERETPGPSFENVSTWNGARGAKPGNRSNILPGVVAFLPRNPDHFRGSLNRQEGNDAGERRNGQSRTLTSLENHSLTEVVEYSTSPPHEFIALRIAYVSRMPPMTNTVKYGILGSPPGVLLPGSGIQLTHFSRNRHARQYYGKTEPISWSRVNPSDAGRPVHGSLRFSLRWKQQFFLVQSHGFGLVPTKGSRFSDDRDVAGGPEEDGLTGGENTRRLADLIVAVSLEPTTSGAILLVNAKSGIPGFHSVRLHRITGARGQDGDRETLVYEVHGFMPPPDAQTSQSPGNASIDLSIGTFIPTSTLNRSVRIRVIGKQNANRTRHLIEAHQVMVRRACQPSGRNSRFDLTTRRLEIGRARETCGCVPL